MGGDTQTGRPSSINQIVRQWITTTPFLLRQQQPTSLLRQQRHNKCSALNCLCWLVGQYLGSTCEVSSPPPRTPPSERVPCSGLLNSGKHCQLNCSLIIVPTFVIVWLNLVNISVGPGDMITSAPLLHLRAESHYRHNTNLHSFIFYCTEAHDMDNIM